MKVLFINTTCGIGSHGRICGELAEAFESQGHECRIAYGRECSDRYKRISHRIGNSFSTYLHILQTRLFDRHGLASIIATKCFLRWADQYDPDLLWLHNIHGYYINYELLFRWIKSRPHMIVRWTLHDCWAFTGHCGFFTMANCNKWRTECNRCPLKTEYPNSYLIDNSKSNFAKKKKSFSNVNQMVLITPSQWLAGLVKKSFLKEYPVEVRNNSINTDVFKPTPSNFRMKYSLEGKTMILGVASVWHKRKGLDDFVELARMLDDQFVIALVGFTSKSIKEFASYSPIIHDDSTTKNVFTVDGGIEPEDKELVEVKKTEKGVVIIPDVSMLYYEITKGKKTAHLGTKIILITRTNSPQELAGLYSTADFFVNPTHEDNYPTTNLEAQACGTYVITYDVGGSKETIK